MSAGDPGTMRHGLILEGSHGAGSGFWGAGARRPPQDRGWALLLLAREPEHSHRSLLFHAKDKLLRRKAAA